MGSNFAFTKISRTSLNLWQMVMQSQRAKESLQKNKVHANYCNRNRYNNCVELTKIAVIAVQLVNCGGPGSNGHPVNSLR